jgi:hypothetical protein
MTSMRFHLICLGLVLLHHSGDALAQFSQPPPSKAAPVCSEKKVPTKECKDLLDRIILTFLKCGYTDKVSCTSESWYSYENSLVRVKWDVLKYYWAYIIDGREYYQAPSDFDWISIDCGQTRRGYIRITAGGATVVKEFACQAPVNNPPGA